MTTTVLNESCLVRLPYRGHIHSTVITFKSGERLVAYTGKTLAEYMAEPEHADLVEKTWAEVLEMDKAHQKSRVTNPEAMTFDRYSDLLECFPPSRFGKIGGVWVFHIGERITRNLVQWCASLNEESCCSWVDFADITEEQIRAKLAAFFYKKGL